MYAQGGGRIFNMEGFGSNGMVRPAVAPYGTTKYGLVYLTKALALELAPLTGLGSDQQAD